MFFDLLLLMVQQSDSLAPGVPAAGLQELHKPQQNQEAGERAGGLSFQQLLTVDFGFSSGKEGGGW